MPSDRSRGYDRSAAAFIASRHQHVGLAPIVAWARALRRGAAVLDLGCGFGDPLATALMREGCVVYGIDASPRLLDEFRSRVPGAPAACETIEDSPFFSRQFDGVVAWGVMFLLPLETQGLVIGKVARALVPGGSFLFTSPDQACSWEDSLTGAPSISPGGDAYRQMLHEVGLVPVGELDDEGENHYFISVKRHGDTGIRRA